MGSQLPSEQLHLTFVTPDKVLYAGEVSMVTIPGAEGEFGVLPRHAPFTAILKSGEVKIYLNDAISKVFMITGGFAEVVDNKCQIAADAIL